MVRSLNRDGNIIVVSQHWLDITGYSREEVIGVPFTSFLTEEYIPTAKREFYHLKNYGFVDNLRYFQ